MCQYSAVNGVPNAWHTSHLTARAIGGAGLVMAEATAVLPEGRITPGCTGLWNDYQAEAWREIVKQLKSRGAVPGIQVGHAGRKASANVPWVDNGSSLTEGEAWETVAPSAAPFGMNITHMPRVDLICSFADGLQGNEPQGHRTRQGSLCGSSKEGSLCRF
jgi:2,4-dienoyl-CoA reductase-like NADH-dependent reductase (Old Yellow Enzyme family)